MEKSTLRSRIFPQSADCDIISCIGISTPSIELLEKRLGEDVLAYITDPRVSEVQGETLRVRVEGLPAERKEGFLEALAASVEERLKTLESTAIDLNLLRKRMQIFEGLRVKEGNASGETLQGSGSLLERVRATAQDIAQDFRDGSPWVKAGYIAGGVVGFLALRWLWRKAFGKGENEGYVKKAAKWTLGAGAAVAGVFGVHKLLSFLRNTGTGQEIISVASGAASAAGGAAQETLTLTMPAVEGGMEVMGIVGEIHEALREGDIGKALEKTLKAGGTILEHAGEFLLLLGSETIRVPGELHDRAKAWLEGEGSFTDFMQVYGETGVLYVVNAGILRKLLTGSFGSLGWKTLGRVAAWPVYACRDGIWLVLAARDLELLKIKFSGIPRRLQYREVMRVLQRFPATQSLRELQLAIRRFVAFDNTLGQMGRKTWKSWGFSEAEIGRLTEQQAAIGTRIQKIMQGMQKLPDDAPQWLRSLHEARDAAEKTFFDLLRRSVSNQGVTAVAQETVASAEEIGTLLRELQAAKTAGDDAKLAELLKNPLLREAADQGNEEAKLLLKAARWAKAGRVAKYVGRGLVGLGVAIDAYLLWDNEQRIAEAKPGEREILEARRISLGAGAAGGTGLLFLSTGGAFIAAPVLIGGSIYAEAIYSDILEWEKEGEHYKGLDPLEIREKLDDLEIGHLSIGRRTAYGDPAIVYLWKKLFWSEEKLEEDAERKLTGIEGINRKQRRALLTAYFMKHLQVPEKPGENRRDFENRVKELVLDRIKYIHILTKGTEHMGFLGAPFYEHADAYAEILEMRRAREESGLPLTVEYEWNGKKRTLDLATLRPENCTEQEGMRILHQYQNELKPQLSFMRMTLKREFLTVLEGSEPEPLDAIAKLVRAELLHGLHHRVYAVEREIRGHDFGGKNTQKRNLVRAVLREALESAIAECTSAFAARENFTVEDFQSYRERLGGTLASAYQPERLLQQATPNRSNVHEKALLEVLA